MKNGAAYEDSSEDDDIFMQGGMPKPISMYSSTALAQTQHVTDLDADSDSDYDDILTLDETPKKRGRGRGARVARAGKKAAASGATIAKTPTQKKPRLSVFDTHDDAEDSDEVVVVESRSTPAVIDAQDASVAASLAQARAVLATQANEDQIAADIERMAKEESERAERLRTQQKLYQEQEKRMQAEQQAKRVVSAQQAPPIFLKVRSGQHQIKMRIRKSHPVLKMLQPFCTKFGLDSSKATMQFDGEDVGEHDTPDSLDLEEAMIIDVIVRS